MDVRTLTNETLWHLWGVHINEADKIRRELEYRQKQYTKSLNRKYPAGKKRNNSNVRGL